MVYRYGSRPGFKGKPGGRPGGGRGRFTPRRKVCSFCVDKVKDIDYKNSAKLSRYISDRGKIEPRRRTGTCARHQRALAMAIKRARLIALLPFVAEHIRSAGHVASLTPSAVKPKILYAKATSANGEATVAEKQTKEPVEVMVKATTEAIEVAEVVTEEKAKESKVELSQEIAEVAEEKTSEASNGDEPTAAS